MFNIKIKNFQSIEDMTFDVSGFTVVVGKNNIGKSAIVRAVDAALNNRVGDSFIRTGKIKSEVNLKKDGLDINWSKGDKAVYKVNGQTYSGLNRSVPQPVLKAGFRKIETDDKKLDVLIAHQFKELFLLDETGSFITDVLSELYDLNTLNDADDLCQKQLRANKSLLKTREMDLETLQEKIVKFQEFETLKKAWEKIKLLNEKVEVLTTETEVLDVYIQQISELSAVLKNLKRLEKIQLPDESQTEKAFVAYQWVKTMCENLQPTLRNVRSLNPVTSVSIPESLGLVMAFQEVTKIEVFYQQLKNLVQIIDKFKEFNTHEVTFKKITEKISGINSRVDNFSYLANTHKFLTDQAVTVRAVKAESLEKQAQYDELNKEYGHYKVCPACGNTL
jgi:DNA repair ATPase RecN